MSETESSTTDDAENSTPTADASEQSAETGTDTATQANLAEDETADSETDTDSETEGGDENESSDAFSAVIEASTLRKAIKAVSVLVDECKVQINDRNARIRAVDPANVGMVDLRMHAAAFESYTGSGETLGLDLERFEEIIKMADSGELVSIELDPKMRTLNISFNGLDFTIALIEPEAIREEPDLPDLELPASVTLEGSDLSRANTAADMVSDHVTLRVDEEAETFIVKAEGDTDDVHLELDEDDLAEITAADATSMFSLEYMQSIAKPVPANTAATVLLGDEFPVVLEYELADGTIKVENFVAPRIQSD
jgi:proliferating cell nuclear antigen